ncbi:MAG TPA: imidazole glycerol phosphate synthase subunit HisH [Armatimonadetes bacterium]|jgi:glutamine amidotransferase|nr:imidazole glycerol phosphate synthase subunit HisH [Armatimonadota bacterium]HHX40947.1 imidazole glycerol phosphate synthase subunit HisH [Armatimonadota bacterium]HOJ23018.1 imidazole glycerol phosphate synthase subunit HisH [Armatimonadota bacterium]HOM83826.1 imidazole glycerol phosphate synthase subunit HisH [Armatimonadota bacterium]HOQ29311.1 imidazole glycerol phosphate synthase subunit HisH [Armatimonadota bacterium]
MIAIVDYRAGNLTSVLLALEHLGVPSEITSDPAKILAAERVVFPGDGAAGESMRNLRELGLIETLRAVVERGTPFFGICIGMQILFDFSEENDGVACLGFVPGRVTRFQPAERAVKIPQMGWNAVRFRQSHPLFAGIEDESEFYFIHSYYPVPADPAHCYGETEYAGVCFASAVGKGNLFATQFHPERSGRIGLRMLRNFTEWDGRC